MIRALLVGMLRVMEAPLLGRWLSVVHLHEARPFDEG
jgi:hypothetical protein